MKISEKNFTFDNHNSCQWIGKKVGCGVYSLNGANAWIFSTGKAQFLKDFSLQNRKYYVKRASLLSGHFRSLVFLTVSFQCSLLISWKHQKTKGKKRVKKTFHIIEKKKSCIILGLFPDRYWRKVHENGWNLRK